MKLYTITGKYIIDELQAPCTLEKAIKLAQEYTQSHAHNRQVFMRVLTEHQPIEYEFGYHIRTEEGLVWHEVCRIISPF